jgi:protein-disulfide isomerase
MKRILLLALALGAAAAARADVAVGPSFARGRGAAAPARGVDEPLVTVVEFADFQCPYCARVHEALVSLAAEYRGRMRMEFRHMPLQFHPMAMTAAEAAVAADAQGKFWAFYDQLFTRLRENDWPGGVRALGRPQLDEVARAVGLDMSAYRAALADHRYRARVDADVKLASDVGVSGTPTFFLNGRKLVGAQPLDRFRRAFDEELARAEKLRAAGFHGAALHDALLSDAASLPELTAN